MNQIFNYLSANSDLLIGNDSSDFYCITQQKFEYLIKNFHPENPPKILISEIQPTKFIASFLAAIAAGAQVFLCNPSWGKQEWEQILKLVQPDIILGNSIDEKFLGKSLSKNSALGRNNSCTNVNTTQRTSTGWRITRTKTIFNHD